MFRRGLCLVLALLVASVHLPLQSLCATSASPDAELPARQPAACPCNPTAIKCECCCGNQPAEPAAACSLGTCSCASSGKHLLAPPLLYLDPPLAPVSLDQPLVEQLADSTFAYHSHRRSPEPPPPR
jgi:hypothetical protein